MAASIDLTGSAVLGGDWDLEYATGSLESTVAFSAEVQAAFGEVLDGPEAQRAGLVWRCVEDDDLLSSLGDEKERLAERFGILLEDGARRNDNGLPLESTQPQC